MQITVREGTISTSKKQEQEECVIGIIQEQLNELHICLDEESVVIHPGLLNQRKEYTLYIKKWIKKIISQNKKYKIYNQKKLENILWCKWAEISYFALAKERNPFNMIKILMGIPLKYWGELVKIRKSRTKKD